MSEFNHGGSQTHSTLPPADTRRPTHHPSTILKLFINGYLNRVHSSRRLELEAGLSQTSLGVATAA